MKTLPHNPLLRALTAAAVLLAVGAHAASGAAAATRRNGITDLQLAVMAQDVSGVRMLLSQGSLVNEQNALGLTALHYAVVPGPEGADYSPHLTAELLRYGADPDMLAENGVSPLLLAVALGNTAVIEGLLAYGGNPNAPTSSGLSILALAEAFGHGDIAAALRKYDARYGVSAQELELIPNLPKAIEFRQELRKILERHGKNPETFRYAVRVAAQIVDPGISREELLHLDREATRSVGKEPVARGKKDGLPLGMQRRNYGGCTEEEDAEGEDCGDEPEDEEPSEEDDSTEWFIGPGLVPTPANEAANQVCRIVVRTVASVVTECWEEATAAAATCATASRAPSGLSYAACAGSVSVAVQCVDQTVTEEVEEEVCEGE